MFEIIDQHIFEDGEVIWEEGSFGDWIYLIESGKVALSKKVRGESVLVDTLEVNDILGQIGYIVDHPRIFTATAVGETTLGIADRSFLDDEYNRLPENFKIIMRSMAARLIRASENVNLGRKAQRNPRSLSLVFKSRESLIKAFTANASEQGVLIKTANPLPKGEIFSLKLQLPEDPVPVQVECEVVWRHTASDEPGQRPRGMGVKFIQISSADKARLSRELKKGVPT